METMAHSVRWRIMSEQDNFMDFQSYLGMFTQGYIHCITCSWPLQFDVEPRHQIRRSM